MFYLPIKSVREEDSPILTQELMRLAKLSQLGFPVADGILVFPPHIHLKTTLEHYRYKDKEFFEQSLSLIKSQIDKIQPPEELVKEFNKRKFDYTKIWKQLLDNWLGQIRSKIFREGFSPKLLENLKALPVFFTNPIKYTASAYFDYVDNFTVIETLGPKIEPEEELLIDGIVQKANKKLIFPQIYTFINDGKIKLVKTSEFTQYPQNQTFIKNPNGVLEKIRLNKEVFNTTTKVFLDISEGLAIQNFVDGFFLDSSNYSSFDELTWKLVEVSSSYENKTVLYKLPDDKNEQVRGTLRLIHDPKLLKAKVDPFVFARHKKSLLNPQLIIPFIRSNNELVQLKRELSALGVSRKGSLKVWMEFATPENFINVENYIESGFDGAIVNLEELSKLLGGFGPSKEESFYYKDQIIGLKKLLEGGLKVFKKHNIPVIFSGRIAQNDEMVKFIVEKGVYGIVVNLTDSYGIRDHLHFIEKRVIQSRAV